MHRNYKQIVRKRFPNAEKFMWNGKIGLLRFHADDIGDRSVSSIDIDYLRVKLGCPTILVDIYYEDDIPGLRVHCYETTGWAG